MSLPSSNTPMATSKRLLLVASTALVSAMLYALTESARYGDAPYYAADIRRNALVEPGHLLWRPLGWLAARAFGGLTSDSDVLWGLQFLSLTFSVGAVVAVYFLIEAIATPLIAWVVALTFAISNGFWDYAFSGCSYGLCVLFLVLAVRVGLVRDLRRQTASAFLAGLLGGLSAASWLLGVLAAPGVVAVVVYAQGMREGNIRAAARALTASALGYSASLLCPLLIAYVFSDRLSLLGIQTIGQVHAGLAAWLQTASHGVPPQFSVPRVVLGWAQSVVSLDDFGAAFRLWTLGQRPFPLSVWLIMLVATYCAATLVASRVVVRFRHLDVTHQALIVGAVLAILANMIFGAFWQGTDLERYLPSLPFTACLLALSVGHSQSAQPGRWTMGALVAVITLAVTNWAGTFAPILAPASARQTWVRELRRNARPGDLVVILGLRPAELNSLHDRARPQVLYVGSAIVMYGNGWRSVVQKAILETHARGRTVFFGESLFNENAAAKGDWSFKERPRPSPQELREFFLPNVSGAAAFEVDGERFWSGH